MPRLAAFPKAFVRALCKDGTMTLQQWVDLAAPLKLDGLEYYSGFLELQDPACWVDARRMVERAGMVIPMLCCSPDFSQPDPELRRKEIEREKSWIRMAATLGAGYCRVLSGQRRPELTIQQGLDLVESAIEACLPEAEACNVTLILENHYKDDFWNYPEFAQKMDVFCALVDRIRHPHFGVNYDPSNAIIAGDDPLELLRRVKDRVVTMHA
ncbi:MAG TPA: sugar phosphate isomerase/epimerase family protein, partial [Opitutaceae bacterium]|nr:sugar phosphate isomerase/epimerase family protein [Opitutaceae bacterium]